jgi:hypothetical protein
MPISEYKGEQIALSSGRLFFNSRSDSIFLNAFQYINLSAGDKVTIDVGVVDTDKEENIFLVNSPKIQFGLDSKGTAEPITKAEQLDNTLTNIMESLATYVDMLQACSQIADPAMAQMLKIPNDHLKSKFREIKKNFDNFKSKISFTI